MSFTLLTVDEASELLRWRKATLYSKVSRREIPFLKLGNSLRFRKEDLMRLLKEYPAIATAVDRLNDTN